jgi:hypothetical protein
MKKVVLILCIISLFTNCGDDNIPEVPKNPVMANLIFPYENSLCTEGTNVTQLESTVLFEWEKDQYTDNYELKLKNLNTGDLSSHKTNSTEISITLKLATPYEWYIISTSNSVSEIVQSATWRFYNAGVAIESYAPFPAEIISPTMAEIITITESEINLNWSGSDVENDIIGYDVFFGTTTTPEIIQSDLNESILKNVSITPNTIYYWKIITKDSHGNKSDSGVYQFKIL